MCIAIIMCTAWVYVWEYFSICWVCTVTPGLPLCQQDRIREILEWWGWNGRVSMDRDHGAPCWGTVRASSAGLKHLHQHQKGRLNSNIFSLICPQFCQKIKYWRGAVSSNYMSLAMMNKDKFHFGIVATTKTKELWKRKQMTLQYKSLPQFRKSPQWVGLWLQRDEAPVPHLLRLLLVPGGAGAELHMKLHPRQSNPQEIVLVISCSSKPWPLKLCLLVQSLIIHLRALRPCTAGKAKHCQDGMEMSQAAAELSTACCSLLPPAGPHSSAAPRALCSPPAQAQTPQLQSIKPECQLIM